MEGLDYYIAGFVGNWQGILGSICHQIPEKSLIMENGEVLLCFRCLGIYSGVAISGLIYIKRNLISKFGLIRIYSFLLISILLNIISSLNLFQYGNHLRYITGFTLGLCLGLIFIKALRIKRSLK